MLVHVIDDSDNWKYGFNTHGFNNISHSRGRKIDQLTNRFKKCSVDLSETIPKEVLNKLEMSRSHLSEHVMDIPPLVKELKGRVE